MKSENLNCGRDLIKKISVKEKDFKIIKIDQSAIDRINRNVVESAQQHSVEYSNGLRLASGIFTH